MSLLVKSLSVNDQPVDETQHAYDFPKLNLILCLENMLKFLGSFKKYVRSDGGGRGGTPEICENV